MTLRVCVSGHNNAVEGDIIMMSLKGIGQWASMNCVAMATLPLPLTLTLTLTLTLALTLAPTLALA